MDNDTLISLKYRVTFNDVPKEVTKLLSSLEKELKISKKLLLSTTRYEDDIDGITSAFIEEKRRLVEIIERRFEDCCAILKGYSVVKNNNKTE